MRFICYRTIVSKVFDGLILDQDDIIGLLTLIKENELTCSLQVLNDPMHELVRILSVEEPFLTWRFVQQGSSLKKTSNISEIVSLEVHTNDELTIKLKPNPSRWTTLDPSSGG